MKEDIVMPFDPKEHYRNRGQLPPHELAKYYGKEVAWSLDGKRIVAHGDDPQEVCAAIQNAGLKSDEVVLTYIPFPEEMILGGAAMIESEDDS